MGHRDLAWRLGGLSADSGFAALMHGTRNTLNDPDEAQNFIDRYL